MPNPAEMLTGLQLQGAKSTWNVIQLIPKNQQGSGGHFSTSYIVENAKGERAFLKAMDYAEAFNSPNPPAALHMLTETYLFEKSVLDVCAVRNLSRVVRVLDEGQIDVAAAVAAPVRVVNFLVFELAIGNVSLQANMLQRLDTAMSLHILHSVAIGLQQLHGEGITHQDIRPSNILRFNAVIAKLADLGRAGSTGHAAPHDAILVPGFRPYAPAEGLYRMDRGNRSLFDWRRCGDMFHFGSMIHFMFRGQMLMPQIRAKLQDQHTPEKWTGTYDAVLPYIKSAFAEVIDDFVNDVTGAYASEVTEALKQTGEPDPRLRGHPRNLGKNKDQYSFERFISLFDKLSAETAWRMRRQP